MPKYYFIPDEDENVYTAEGVRIYMLEHCRDKLIVNEARITREEGIFYCHAVGEFGEKGPGYNPCGRLCSDYKPRNGKSGICAHHGFPHEPTDKTRTFKIKPNSHVQNRNRKTEGHA